MVNYLNSFNFKFSFNRITKALGLDGDKANGGGPYKF